MSFKTNDNGIDRDMTDAEEKAFLATIGDAETLNKAQADAQAAKVIARQAVLDKLGLTQDEAQALLG